MIPASFPLSPVERFELVKEQVQIEASIPTNILARTAIEHRMDDMFPRMLLTMHNYMLKPRKPIQGKGLMAFPSSPWQHFKQSYAPEWFLKRYPTRLTDYVYFYTKEERLCPHLDVPEEEIHVEFLSQGQVCRGALDRKVEERVWDGKVKVFSQYDRETWPKQWQPYVPLGGER